MAVIVVDRGRVQKVLKAIEPKGEARSEYEILHQILANLRVPEAACFTTIEGLFNLMARDTAAFSEMTWAVLGDTGQSAKI